MATSALKASSAPDPATLDDTSSDYQAKYKSVQDAQAQLTALLSQRSENKLSPSMLAVAGELLDPGRTGSFGEAIGRAAKAYGPAQALETKQAQENAMSRMQIAQMGLEQSRKGEALKRLKAVDKPAQTIGAVSPTPLDSEAVAAGTQIAPLTGVSTTKEGGPAISIQGQSFTPRKIRDISLLDPDLGKALADEYKLGIDAQKLEFERQRLALEGIVTQPAGSYNKLTGAFTAFPGAAPIAEPVPELGGNIMMPPEDAAALRSARGAGDTATVYKILDKYTRGVGPRMGVSAPAEGETPADMTVEGINARQAATQALATETAKGSVKRTQDKLDAGASAISKMTPALGLKDIAAQPNMSAVLGVFEHPTIMSALGAAVERGLAVGDYNIALPQVRDITAKLQAANIPQIAGETPQAYDARKQKVMDNLGLATSYIAQIKFEASRLSKGQGVVSDRERELFAQMGPSEKDTVATILKKSDMLLERERFNQVLADKLTSTGMQYDKFKSTPAYKAMETSYINNLRNIAVPGAVPAAASAATPAPAGKPGISDLREKLNKQLGIGS